MPTNWLTGAATALAGQLVPANAIPTTPGITRTAGVQAPAAPRSTPFTAKVPEQPRSLAVGAQGRGYGLYGQQNRAPSWIGQGFGLYGDDRPNMQSSLSQPEGGALNAAGDALTNFGQTGGMAGASGFALLDQHNAEINAAAQKYGVPANLLKSMINRESSGDWDRDNRVYSGFRGQRMLPFVGIFEDAANSWGLDFDSMIGNKQAQIDGMAKILNGLASDYGGYENAAKVYFGGEAALRPGGFTDELGMNSADYGQKAIDLWKQLDSQAGYTGGYDLPTYRAGESGYGNNAVVQQALEYVGTAYVWGGIPEAGQDPRQTGWDCSGMTRWLDQKFGDGSLPAGSHYQYQFAQQTGRLFTDMSQLKPGDLIFADTGWYGGAGGNMNRAGHVGIYIGNGQMLHAANPSQGTIVSPVSGYNVLGAMHQSFSSAGGGVVGGGMFDFSNNPYRH